MGTAASRKRSRAMTGATLTETMKIQAESVQLLW